MKKRFVAIVLVAVLALSCLAACSKKDEGPLTLVYAEVNPQDTIVGQVTADFKAKVEELSKGKIIIDVQIGRAHV